MITINSHTFTTSSFRVMAIVIIQLLFLNLAWAINTKLESALIQEDWQKVSDLLESKKSLTVPEKFLKAHGYIAINRNNDALAQFLNISTKDSFSLWESWTADFLKENPRKVTALFLRGDALVRNQKFDNAITHFSQALDLKPRSPMVLNSRGAAYASINNLEAANQDFYDVTQNYVSFSEGFASYGSTLVEMGETPEEAEAAFNKSLDLSPNYVLALNGRASAKFAVGNLDESIKDLKEAISLGILPSLPVSNMVLIAEKQKEMLANIGDHKTKIKPGTPIEVITSYTNSLSASQSKTDLIQIENNIKINKKIAQVGEYLSTFSEENTLGQPVLASKQGIRGFIKGPGGVIAGVAGVALGYQVGTVTLPPRLDPTVTNKYELVILQDDQNKVKVSEGKGKKKKKKKKVTKPKKKKKKATKPKKKKKKKKKKENKTKDSGDGVEKSMGSIISPLGVDGSPIPKPNIDLVGPIDNKKSIDIVSELNKYGENLIRETRIDNNFYQEIKNIIISKPGVNPGGVTYIGILRSQFDTGKWLSTAYGLIYNSKTYQTNDGN